MANGESFTQRFGTGLQAVGAGLLGQGTQFAALQEQKRGRLSKDRQEAMLRDAFTVKTLFEQGTPESIRRGTDVLSDRLTAIQGAGGDIGDTSRVLQKAIGGDIQGALTEINGFLSFAEAQGVIKLPRAAQKPAGTREFEFLAKGLSDEQQEQAKLIELGLAPRAVGSAIQTIAKNDLTDLVADASATIKKRVKFAESSAVSRSKTIDAGFERMTKIDAGLRNIDRAIVALEGGAGVGAIERLLPSIRAASVTLDNIQGSMALDVIGAVTFGALSKGELDLAKEIALPTGLDSPQLIQHLKERKVAQEKLRGYFNEQIQFLDQGGTVAGFLRQQEGSQGQQAQQAAPAQATQRLVFNPQTGQLE